MIVHLNQIDAVMDASFQIAEDVGGVVLIHMPGCIGEECSCSLSRVSIPVGVPTS